MDLNNISGLSLTDRKYRSFGQEGMPVTEGSPIVQLVGGVCSSGGFSYGHLEAVPFLFTPDGKLMVDTELIVSGATIYLGSQTSYHNVIQQTTPWVVSGALSSLTSITNTVSVSGGVLASQGATPWEVKNVGSPLLLTTLLNNVGSNAGSFVSASINTAYHHNKIFYLQYSNGGTGSTMTVVWQASPDDSSWFTLGSAAYTDTAINEVSQNNYPHPYVRAITEANNGGNLTVNLVAQYTP